MRLITSTPGRSTSASGPPVFSTSPAPGWARARAAIAFSVSGSASAPETKIPTSGSILTARASESAVTKPDNRLVRAFHTARSSG